jgi:serine/threonine protein phosphatase 1
VRHIVIGDIHGCYDELQQLLDTIGPTADDDVVSVGDIVRKGPAPDRCLDLWRTRGYRAVRGNQEEELLRIIDGDGPASKSDQTVLSRPDLLEYIRSLPVLLDLPAAGAAVVHGGMLPGKTVREYEAATTLRYVRRDGDRWLPVPKGKEKRGDRFWAELWDGDRTILYGHTPRDEVRFDRKAIGLDTGCVYGGRLSAAVWADGRWQIVDVRARRNYARRAPWGRLRRWLRKMMPK